ncbi:MAG TPA: metallophosphoesterase [archaeon]|nr:metallophosphoesterase [archaeon]
MIIGIVSDSHDNVPMLKRAVEHFNASHCGLVIHAGDLVAPFSMAVLDKLDCPFRAVYGNNDGEKVGLKMKAAAVGGSIEEPPIVVKAANLRIAALHDCNDWQLEARKHDAEVVVFGHTHDVLLERAAGADRPVGINPGECGGWLTGSCTAALFDTDTFQVRIIDLKLEPGKEVFTQ